MGVAAISEFVNSLMSFFETLLHLGKESKLSMHSIFAALIR